MKDEEETYGEYCRYIEKSVKSIQTEMSLGNIKTEETLVEVVERVSAFIVQEEAFAFFNNHAPYEWKEYVNEEELKRFAYHLGALALHIANSVVSIDVFEELQYTAGYNFLIGEGEKSSIRLKNGSRVVLEKHWKADASGYDYLAPLEITEFEGQSLTTYKEGDSGDPVYVLEHQDTTLVWISSKLVPKPCRSVLEFEERKCAVLMEYGCPEDRLWLTEVQSLDDFSMSCGYDPYVVGNLHEFHYVVFYHEDGEVFVSAGFNTDEEFERGCEAVADYLK